MADDSLSGEALVGTPSTELSDGFVIDDAANLRRVKALTATVPIEDLERTKTSLGGTFWGEYDLRTLAVAAIDWIALALGVTDGASPEAAVNFLAGQAKRQQPGRDAEEHRQVASRILDKLIGEGEVTRRYVDHAVTPPVVREFSFRLVYEQLSGAATVHLRVSEEAINVLVAAPRHGHRRCPGGPGGEDAHSRRARHARQGPERRDPEPAAVDPVPGESSVRGPRHHR